MRADNTAQPSYVLRPDATPGDATDTTNSGGSSGSSSTFSGSAPAGQSQVPPPRVYKSRLSPSEHKEGDRGRNSSHVLPTNRGRGSGEGGDDGGEVGAPSSVTADPCDADLRDARQPPPQRTQLYPPSAGANTPDGTAGGGGVDYMRLLLPSISTLLSRAT